MTPTARATLDASEVVTPQRFMVRGVPAPQGSKSAFVVNGRAVMRESSKNVKSWRQAVSFVLQDWQGAMYRGPVSVSVIFYMPKPKSAKKGERYAAKRPDIDKLCRAMLDAMTGIVFHDDGQVVDLQATKQFEIGWVGALFDVAALSLESEAAMSDVRRTLRARRR